MSADRHDRVRRRAYELWEQQGGEHGRHEDHWHAADAEIGPDEESTDEGADEATTIAAPDGTTLTAPADAEAKPARKRAAPKAPATGKPAAKPLAADKAPPKPRKPK